MSSASETPRANRRSVAAGLGYGALIAAGLPALDAVIGSQPLGRAIALSATLLALALGAAGAGTPAGRRTARSTGAMLLLGAGVAALLVTGLPGSPPARALAAGLILLPAALGVGASLPDALRSTLCRASFGVGLALGVLAHPRIGLPATIAVASVALIVGLRVDPRTPGLPRDRRTIGTWPTVTIAVAASASTMLGAQLAGRISLAGAVGDRVALISCGLALALIAAVPIRLPTTAALAAAAAGAWWLAASLVRSVEPGLAAAPGASYRAWLVSAGLVAIPAAVAAAALVRLVADSIRRLALSLAAVAVALPLIAYGVLPAIGPFAAGAALALVLLAAALLSLSRPPGGERSISLLVGAGALALASLAIAAVWRPALLPASDTRLLAQRQGPTERATLWAHASDPALRWLTVDGLAVGQSYGGIDAVQQMLAHLPFALRPSGESLRMLIVGHGLGVVAGEAMRHDRLDDLVVLESSDVVIEATAEITTGTVTHADPPSWLRTAGDAERFDVIVVPGRLLPPGLEDDRLWSREFYRACRGRMHDDARLLRPVPLDLSPADLSSVVRTFLDEFEHAQLWLAPPTHAVLVGGSTPSTLDATAIDELLRRPAVRDWRRYGWNSGATLISMLTAERAALETIAGNGPAHTSMHRRLAGLDLPTEDARRLRRARALERLLEVRPARPDWIGLAGYDVPAIESAHRVATRLLELFVALGERRIDAVDGALGALRTALDAAPGHALADSALDAIIPLAYELAPDGPRVRAALGERLLAAGRATEAEGELREALRLDPRDGASFALLGRALAMQGEYDAAVTQLGNALAFGADTPRTRFERAVALRLSGQREAAAGAIDELLTARPGDPAALEQRALLTIGDPAARPEQLERALGDAERAVQATGGRSPGVLHTLALAQGALGRTTEAVESAARALEVARALGASALEPQLRATLERLRAESGPGGGGLGKRAPGT